MHFLAVPESKSHQALYRLTLASGAIDKLSLADDTEVVNAVMDLRNERVIGYKTYTDKPARAWIEKDDPSARFYRALERAFPGQTLVITSVTSDGALAVAFVQSDVNPGDFYVLDTQALKADFIRASRAWIDPRTMRPREPITLQARDGLQLHGYVTRPAGPPPHPMVVLPHGGPHEARDWWEFDDEAQLLANRGYAVLQVNYRGSAGFGIDFKSSGYKEWGARMQDDLTDATRWAIENKIAAPDRICIYGSNYGGYAALMGVAREPGLYRCAISFAGNYDLEVLQSSRRLQSNRNGRTYIEETLGDDPAQLRARSPVHLATSIQAPVLLIHGTEDFRADINQAQAMRTALERAGKRFEWLALKREGDWIYDEKTRRKHTNASSPSSTRTCHAEGRWRVERSCFSSLAPRAREMSRSWRTSALAIRSPLSASLPRQRQAVADRHEREIHALVTVQHLVEVPQRDRVRVGDFRIRDAAAPERVVDADETPWTQQREHALVVAQVSRLVGIDEGEVEGLALPRGQQSIQRLVRGRQSQVDLVVDSRRPPVTPGDRGPLLADVAGDDAAVVWQRRSHGQGGVTREHPDFDVAARTGEPGQQCHELALFRCDLHPGVRHRSRLFAQRKLRGRFA